LILPGLTLSADHDQLAVVSEHFPCTREALRDNQGIARDEFLRHAVSAAQYQFATEYQDKLVIETRLTQIERGRVVFVDFVINCSP